MDGRELVGNCTGIALLVSLATTLIYARDEIDYHGLYVSLQSLPRDVCLTAACAQLNTYTLSWGVEPSFVWDSENLEQFSLIASGLFDLYWIVGRGAFPEIIACNCCIPLVDPYHPWMVGFSMDGRTHEWNAT